MRKTSKAFSLLLALVLVFAALPAGVFAGGNTEKSVSVFFSAQQGGAFLFNRQEITVTDGLAEEYGYSVAQKDHNGVPVEAPTLFDALIAVHKAKYGDEFTAASAKEYLDISSGGMLTKAFGENASYVSIFVNGEMPNDNIVGEYGTTGYNADTARLVTGDDAVLWFYQDSYWMDYYTYFTETEKTVSVNEEFTLTLEGYMAMSAMGYDPVPKAINGADGYITLNTVNADGTLSEALTDADGLELLIDENGQVKLSFDEAGQYIVTANGMEGDMGAPIIAPWCVVNVEELPASVTIKCEDSRALNNSTLLARKGDKFLFKAYDQNGNETPVKWSTSSDWAGSIDESSGIFTVTDSLSSESCRSVGIKAVSAADSSISEEASFAFSGYMFSEYQKTQSKALSSDGQTPLTISLTGGCSGHSVWSFEGMDGIAVLSEGQDLSEKKSSVSLKALRPGTFTAGFSIDFNEELTDTAEITVTGVAVEDSEGRQEKTYLLKTADKPSPTVQLTAYVGEGRTAEHWFSSDETVASVDENGLVTALGIGSAIITAEDSEGDTGGIKVVVSEIDSAAILTAETETGDWYPAFSKDCFSYTVALPSAAAAVLKYKAAEGAVVKLGNEVQSPDENGIYNLNLKTNTQTLTVESADGSLVNTYSFVIQEKKQGYPDRVTDFLCINGYYTNTALGAAPWKTLAGDSVSIGNFGGYITYYYEDGLRDDPNNKYGIDFYVYGNAAKDTSSPTKTSFFEPAQAWVSEDGLNWYALAGSAHYEEGVDWNYSVKYSKTENGKTAWEDSRGNKNDGAAYTGNYPLSSVYFMNNLADFDSITLSGILLPAGNGSAAVSGEATDAYPVKWGYADCFANGVIGEDVNPYADNTDFDLPTNGFDLAWAVDADGNIADVSHKEFHYVKLQTASNIWHPSFNEKSPEIAGVLRTSPQTEAVGKTKAPEGVTITDGANTKKLVFEDNQQSYSVNLGDMKYVSLSVDGADEGDNIYINNQRVAYNEAAGGIKVTKEKGEKPVRIIVQNGDKEPAVYLLRLTSTATETDDLIEGIKINALGNVQNLTTKDGENYSASVGYRINSVSIVPVTDKSVSVMVNGAEAKDEYELKTGENIFVVTGEKDGARHTVTLKITRDSAPSSSGTIKVYFTLLGDKCHGSGEIHTLKDNNLTTWIERTAYELDSPATVLDVLEKALSGKYTFVNSGGNYITKIGDLAEFANGASSGWMFTVNGKHLSKGVAEQTVKNGDKIVFHYSDDYAKEQSSEKLTGGSSSSSSSEFTVRFESNGGTAIKNAAAAKNAALTKPQDPQKDGFKFAGWYTDKMLTKEYDFSQKVTSSFTLYAKWTEGETVFKDVEKNAWYYDAVQFVYGNGLMNGKNNTEFEPDGLLSRGMLTAVLYRMAGEPENAAVNTFSDVENDAWYASSVIWANEIGLVNGFGEGFFRPEEAITREQLAAVLYRYAGSPAVSGDELAAFNDADEISGYAKKALLWAVQEGIICGRDNGNIDAKKAAARAEAAAVLKRYSSVSDRYHK